MVAEVKIRSGTALTLREYLDTLAPGFGSATEPPPWPPDAFALAASVLQRSDAYSYVLRKWQPRSEWNSFISDVGSRWRRAVNTEIGVPREVRRWWHLVTAAGDTRLDRVRNTPVLCRALLQLCAAADEASLGVGIPDPDVEPDRFLLQAHRRLLLREKATLCKQISSSRLVVLPKLHTPRSGITLRSLTHHLALWHPGEVYAKWVWAPWLPKTHGLNLLLLPWPDVVTPRAFRECEGELSNLPSGFGFFTCDAGGDPNQLLNRLLRAKRSAEAVAGHVDAIILPEMSLSRNEPSEFCRRTRALIIGGHGKASRGGRPGSNSVVFAVPVGRAVTKWDQRKHHRWRIDSGQIHQYGLGGRLDPMKQWWEHIRLTSRRLTFWSINSWLTMYVLICEDLARPDPVADLVRAVGPNLVVAPLMDGPQLGSRWSARAAAVLADDPGCSVLTLTSIGMALLSCPPGKAQSRVVALWKDARTGTPLELELGVGAAGLLLNLTREVVEEWTADGRSDGGATGYLLLNGVHQVYV